LGDVDPFAATIIPRTRIPFRVLVRHHRTLRFQHGPADDVFRRNQLDLMALAAEFALDRGSDFRVGLGERGREERVGRGGGLGAWGRGGHGTKYLHRRKPLRARRSGLVWRSQEVPARYHIARNWPSTCGTGLLFMPDM